MVDTPRRGSCAEPQPAQLAPHRGDVLVGRDPRVLPRLDRVLLGGEPERVVAHRVEHVVAGHALEARVDVGADVAEGMADVQAGAARVREHVEHVQLRAVGDRVEPVCERAAGVRRPEGPLRFPVVLPPLFDLVGEPRGVAVRTRLVAARRRFAHRAASVPVSWARQPAQMNQSRWYSARPRGCSSVW